MGDGYGAALGKGRDRTRQAKDVQKDGLSLSYVRGFEGGEIGIANVKVHK